MSAAAVETPRRIRDAARTFHFLCYGLPPSMGRFFGPRWAQARADILTALHSGCRVPKSKAAWGIFKSELYAAFGPADRTGMCEAEIEAHVEAAILACPP